MTSLWAIFHISHCTNTEENLFQAAQLLNIKFLKLLNINLK